MQRAAAAIRKAGKVVFAGMGSSLFASIPAAYYLESHGIQADVVEASEVLHFGLARTRGAAMVLVSRSGETVEISKLLPAEIGLTNVRESKLARESRYPISLNSEPDRMVAVQTYTGMLVTLLLLAAAVLEEPIGKWRAALDDASQALSDAIEDAIAASAEWTDFLADAEVIYLLGRGPSLASVREGALLFNEASRTPSVAMSAAQFRHGPVEVVDEQFSRNRLRVAGSYARGRLSVGARPGIHGRQRASLPEPRRSIAVRTAHRDRSHTSCRLPIG